MSSSPQQELNLRPRAYKALALRLSYAGNSHRAHDRNRTGNLRFTKALHYPLCYEGKHRRADDGDRTRLNQLGKLMPHQAASSAEDPSRISSAVLKDQLGVSSLHR